MMQTHHASTVCKLAAMASLGICGRRIYLRRTKPHVTSRNLLSYEETASRAINDFQMGSGTFGDVYWGQDYAVKKLATDKAKLHATIREILLLRHLKHDNIIAATVPVPHDISDFTKRGCFLRMTRAEGDLEKEIQTNALMQGALTDQEIRKYTSDILKAVAFLHSAGIAHRDLKLKNVLVTNGGDGKTIKLCDFGLAKVLNQKDFPGIQYHRKRGTEKRRRNSIGVGTGSFKSPEILTDPNYTTKTDIWSVGCIMAELYAQKVSRNPDVQFLNINAGHIFDNAAMIQQTITKMEDSDKSVEANKKIQPKDKENKKFTKRQRIVRDLIVQASGCVGMTPQLNRYAPKLGSPELQLLTRMLERDPAKRINAMDALRCLGIDAGDVETCDNVITEALEMIEIYMADIYKKRERPIEDFTDKDIQELLNQAIKCDLNAYKESKPLRKMTPGPRSSGES